MGVGYQSFSRTSPGIGCRLMMVFRVGHQKIADLKDEIASSAITYGKQVSGAEPIEHRETHSEEWDSETLRGLAPM